MKTFLLILNVMSADGSVERVQQGLIFEEPRCYAIGTVLSQWMFKRPRVVAVNFECIPQMGA